MDRAAIAGPDTTLTLIRQGERRALVRCRTNVRNTHALRAQLRSARLRLLGDSVHDRSKAPARAQLSCLHLSRIAFHHPAVKSKIVIASKAPEGFEAVVTGRRDVLRPLHAALTRRLSCAADPDTDSYRLINGDVEGVKGLTAEKFGPVVVLQISQEQEVLTHSLRAIARWYVDTLHAAAVYSKRFVKDRSAVDKTFTADLRSSEPFYGRAVPQQIEIVERGLKFAIRPYDGFSVGLFLDHRDNRRRIRSLAQGRDVLNLFAYTCGFSVAAAAGGAKSATSVDISSKHLQRGRANFQLNGLDLAMHEFICSDAGDYLKRAARQQKQFDLIVLDSPSFAHGRKRRREFSITRDLGNLVASCVALLRPGGVMMVSTSYRRMSLRSLRERIKQGSGGRKFRVVETPPLPVDFASDPDHAKTVFVQYS